MGVIGLGRGFALTAPTLKLDPRVKVVAGCDPRPNAQVQFRLDFDCDTFSTLERVSTHGVRRAEEMREVAKTVKDAKVNSEMSKTVAESFELFMQKDE